jgi:recombinational DNA repair protein (RecF pathway)
MSYAIIKTPALVLRIIPQGEASLDVVLFTRSLGKIQVRAQSARKHTSKMNMFLTRFREVMIDVVLGSHTWRLTGITGESLSPGIFRSDRLLHAWYRTLRLVEFLVVGESAHPELYDFFSDMIRWCENFTQTSSLDEGLEYYLVLQTLAFLGYASDEDFIPGDHAANIAWCLEHRSEVIKNINEGISATQIMLQ